MLDTQLDAQAVVASAQQSVPPAGWRVWRERRGYFFYLALTETAFLAFSIVGALYLQGHPNTVYVLGTYGDTPTGPLDTGPFMAWRAGDFVVLGLLAILGVYALIRGTYQAAAGGGQLLVLTPDGLVFSSKNQARAFPFAPLRPLATVRVYGTMRVRFIFADCAKAVIKLDGRFGRVKPSAGTIIAA